MYLISLSKFKLEFQNLLNSSGQNVFDKEKINILTVS